MSEWERQGTVANLEQWEIALDRQLLARRLNQLNADYSADLGRLMEWRSWQMRPGSEDFAKSRDLAEDFYIEAISKRPSWGFGWAHYAENQLLRRRTGREFRTALSRAIELAPWEPGVHRKVAWMGMATWDQLPPDLRERVKDNIERAVQLDVHRHEIVRLAVQYDWLPHLRPMMRTKRQMDTMSFVLKQIEAR